jgi:hypothetical protein
LPSCEKTGVALEAELDVVVSQRLHDLVEVPPFTGVRIAIVDLVDPSPERSQRVDVGRDGELVGALPGRRADRRQLTFD